MNIKLQREEIIERAFSRFKGRKGAGDMRAAFMEKADRIMKLNKDSEAFVFPGEKYAWKHATRRLVWIKQEALALAEKCSCNFDEHGRGSGDYRETVGRDFVGPWESKGAPYFDSGGEGLALIVVYRTRVYAKSCTWRPSQVKTAFLIGKNEAGTYFSHPVPSDCANVRDALAWIWRGNEFNIIKRQGDVALCKGKGKKIPPLPRGHTLRDDGIFHETHEMLPLPGKGEKIIVGRRAAERASSATRD